VLWGLGFRVYGSGVQAYNGDVAVLCEAEAEGQPRVDSIDWHHPQHADHGDLEHGLVQVAEVHDNLPQRDWDGDRDKHGRDQPCDLGSGIRVWCVFVVRV